MRVILFLFILATPFYASAGNWSCMPDNGFTYAEQKFCPCKCINLEGSGKILDKELIKEVSVSVEVCNEKSECHMENSKKVVEDPSLKKDKDDRLASEAEANKLAKEERAAKIEQLKSSKDENIRALVELLDLK